MAPMAPIMGSVRTWPAPSGTLQSGYHKVEGEDTMAWQGDHDEALQAPGAYAENPFDPPAVSPHTPLVVDARAAADDEVDEGEQNGDDGERGANLDGDHSAPWRRELHRWLATLNPGRTQREYEKAVGYFFQTPGVP